MTQIDLRLPILATGLATCLGMSAAETHRARLDRTPTLRKCPSFIGSDFKKQVVAFQHRIPIGLTAGPRLKTLANAALTDLASQLDTGRLAQTGINFQLVLPEIDNDTSFTRDALANIATSLQRDVEAQLNLRVLQAAVHFAGDAAFGQVMADLLTARAQKPTLVLAADSYAGRDRLNAASRRDDLFSNAQPYGFIPGEGAACILIDGNSSGPQLGYVVGAGASLEQCKQDDLGDSDYSALSTAWRTAGQYCSDTISHVMTGWNNNRYQAAEMSYARLRANDILSPSVEIEHLAIEFGDTGAAAQLLGAMLSTRPQTLVSASSRWSGLRSAVVVDNGSVAF